MSSVQCFLALGSNLGDRREHLRQALSRLSRAGELEIVAVSRLYETAPVGPPQGAYYNAVAAIMTALPPRGLLTLCRATEDAGGRQRTVRWGPRTIDIDILDYAGTVVETETLCLPHPELTRRSFVLVPLRDVAPDWVHPVLKRTVADLIASLGDTASQCVAVEGADWFGAGEGGFSPCR